MKWLWISLWIGMEAVALSPIREPQHYLWNDRLTSFDRLCFKRSFKAPPEYTVGINGGMLVSGTARISVPSYDCVSSIDSPEAAKIAFLGLMEAWTKQTLQDKAFCDEFRLLTYRPIFPAGCSFICSRGGWRKPCIFFRAGEVRVSSETKQTKELISDTLQRLGTEQDWPFLREATAAWLQHPQLNEEEANELLDRELQKRAERLAQEPTLKKYPDEWAHEPAIALLEHLEARGFVVLSLEKATPWDAHPEHGAPFVVAIGGRTPHTHEQGERLIYECIEVLQNQLPPIEETLAKKPRGLSLRNELGWFQWTRVPVCVVFNFPSPSPWDEQFLINIDFSGGGYCMNVLPPLTNVTSPIRSSGRYWLPEENLSASEFPQAKAFFDAAAAVDRRSRPQKKSPVKKTAAVPEAHAQ